MCVLQDRGIKTLQEWAARWLGPWDPSQPQWRPISSAYQISATRLAPGLQRAHRAFPVDRAGARARIEFLIVHDWFQQKCRAGETDRHRDGIGDTGARRAPGARRGETDLVRRK